MRGAGEEGLGELVRRSGLAKPGDGGVKGPGGVQLPERVHCATNQQVGKGRCHQSQTLSEVAHGDVELVAAAGERVHGTTMRKN